jgi:hypothetical protein
MRDVMDLFVQMTTLMALLIGILVGEILAFRAFGRPKAKILLVDLVVFVIVISLIYGFISFTQLGAVFYVANFFIGAVTIVLVRGLESLFRLTESPRAEEKVTVNVIRALSRYGLDDEEIKGVLKRSGMSPKVVDRYSGMIEQNVPSYVPKLVKMEAEIADIKAGMDSLTAGLNRSRRSVRRRRKAHK